MNILIIARGYPTKKYIMNGIFEYDQAKALVEAGHNVIFAALDMRSIRRKRKWIFESFEKDGIKIEVVNIPCGRIPKPILNKVREIALEVLYKKIENKYESPDLIHAHFIENGFVTAKVLKKYKVPLVLTEHYSGMNNKNIDPYLFKLGKFTYPRMNKVIAVSNHLANNIKDTFGIDVSVLPNIVDTTSFEYIYIEKNSKNFDFISTGNLMPNKRMDLLIEAFSEAFNDDKKIRLYIFGEGPERKNLEKLIINNNMEDQIFLMGLVKRTEIANKMKTSNCFVLASRLETFGVAYIEALLMGLPVISTKCGGPEDFITKENGVLVPVDDKNRLVQALKDMYKNNSNYDNIRISNSIKDKFGPLTISSRLAVIYKELLDGENKGRYNS